MVLIDYKGKLTEDIWDLLLLADPLRKSIEEYVYSSTLFVIEENDKTIAIAVLTRKNRWEIKNIAVASTHQRKGYATELITEIKKYTQQNRIKELFIGTGNSSLSQLALYQRCGFRIDHIVKDFFTPYPENIYENGIQCRDLIMLKITFH